MRRPFLYGKVHRVFVTQADLEYEGSLTLDQDLMDAAGFLPNQQIEVYDVTNGARLSTYLIAGPRGAGECCINGAAAHLVSPGDRVIIAGYCELDDHEVAAHEPRVVLVKESNRSWELVGREEAFRRVP
jgi:aspartate 1-decarboxylase